MSPQQFFDEYQGQSLLYAPSKAREYLRGQCVQSVCFYVADNGKPVMWVETAYEWWSSNMYADQYDRIPNSATAVPQPGDLIVWDKSLANSGNAGHIAVCHHALPGTGTFVSVDQNWGGKTVHMVTHDYNKVVGWLRLKNVAVPAPAPAPVSVPQPAPQTQGDEMISNADQATKMYKMLRPNGTPNQAEIDSTAGKRSFAQFVNDAQNEVAQRDANLRAQADQLSSMSGAINAQNQTITDLTAKLNDSNTTATQKQAALNDALAQIAKLNAQLTTDHDELAQLQKSLPVAAQPATPEADKLSLVAKIFSVLLKIKK